MIRFIAMLLIVMTVDGCVPNSRLQFLEMKCEHIASKPYIDPTSFMEQRMRKIDLKRCRKELSDEILAEGARICQLPPGPDSRPRA